MAVICTCGAQTAHETVTIGGVKCLVPIVRVIDDNTVNPPSLIPVTQQTGSDFVGPMTVTTADLMDRSPSATYIHQVDIDNWINSTDVLLLDRLGNTASIMPSGSISWHGTAYPSPQKATDFVLIIPNGCSVWVNWTYVQN